MQHTWYERAKCNSCGYLWTTQSGQSVVCACGNGEIIEGEPYGLLSVTDELEFKQAVADDLTIDINELDLIDGSA